MLALFLIYWLLPNGKVDLRRTVAAAIGVGVTLELLKWAEVLLWPYASQKLDREHGPFIYSVTIITWSFLVLCWYSRGPSGRPAGMGFCEPKLRPLHLKKRIRVHMSDDLTRRDVVKIAGVAAVGAPFIQTAKAATNAVQFGMIGTGSRGTYLLKHLAKIDAGRCVALCDIDNDQLDKAQKTIGGNPKRFKDYRELLAQKDVEAVFVTTPLFLHFPITKDALLAGKNVFCEKSLVFKPEEVQALRALKAEHSNQVLQTGL